MPMGQSDICHLCEPVRIQTTSNLSQWSFHDKQETGILCIQEITDIVDAPYDEITIYTTRPELE